MNGEFDLITLIALIVAAAAVFKLRSVLGQRSDEDDQRVERLRTREREARSGSATSGDVITLPRRDREGVPAGTDVAADAQMAGPSAETRVRSYGTSDPTVTEGMLAIAKLDPSFDPDAFVVGAGRAYEMIVSGFAEGNRKALKDLLGREVYDGFVAVIADRESKGQTVEQQFVGIKKADIVEAEVRGGIAYLTVRFLSELITAVRDKSGALVSGDPVKIKDVTDIWTFSRDISTGRARSNPNWRLVGTQAPS